WSGCSVRILARFARMNTRSALLSSSLSLILTLPALSVGNAPPAMLGFDAAGAANQQALEQRFDAALDPAQLRDWLQRLAAEPNHVGAPHDKANAEFMLQQFRD